MRSSDGFQKPNNTAKLKDIFRINYGVLSQEEQDRIKQASVLIVGVGAVGGIIAEILARSGIGSFTLIDPDKYEWSNSNRHIGWYTDTLGKYKSDVIKNDILRINPEANIKAYTKKLSFGEIKEHINTNSIIIAAADDLAFSSKIIIMAQERKKFALTFMPSGLSGFILVFPPNLSSVIDPAELFGAPRGLAYKELRQYLENPLTKFGRRWYILNGKWRIRWFRKWIKGEVSLAQICPNTWLGSSLACIEVIKYLTGKGKPVEAPKMWNLQSADNRIRVETFRRRTKLSNRLINWFMNISLFGIGEHVRTFTTQKTQQELIKMEKQENADECFKPPFLWRHFI
ncbi:ThiF family adenylyltransferase [Chloroflexota bacterium]